MALPTTRARATFQGTDDPRGDSSTIEITDLRLNLLFSNPATIHPRGVKGEEILKSDRHAFEEFEKIDDQSNFSCNHFIHRFGMIRMRILTDARGDQCVRLLDATEELESPADVIETGLVVAGQCD